ncbi:MOSC domain-containing protein [Cecembia lonarensis]|uniref:MOSC domain-containing protein n=1 Tax=Cecembia lonarensis (strain CCUG 58316 / KCTC 22772 / LW9) TaxID=1225176 RepID=K1KYX1_CECL9|nr:MOSC N-terminal beta barrel domain-containing protein [Cecembia lonarensis]EKB47691.1 hypothetical protein B879_03710 [Cecembia lonarensis LW9]
MYLQDIYIYPIKSLRGIRLEQANLEERGFQFDRRWMLVDMEGQFLSQRTIPRMALIQVIVDEEGLKVYSKNQPEDYIMVPYRPQTKDLIDVQIWEDQVKGQLVSQVCDAWFSKIIGFPCQLVFMPVSTSRKLKQKYAVNGESVSFADGMPYLLIGQSSLDDLNSRLMEAVPMDRFRPNLVFAGGDPFEEDHWDEVRIGEAVFKVTKPCARCVMTTVDQQTAEKGKEPLKTLATYRTVNNQIMFGQNMLLLEGAEVKVGDPVVIEKK